MTAVPGPIPHAGLKVYEANQKLKTYKNEIEGKELSIREKISNTFWETIGYVSCGDYEDKNCCCNRFCSLVYPTFFGGLAAGLITGLCTGYLGGGKDEHGNNLHSPVMGALFGLGIPLVTTTLIVAMYYRRYSTLKKERELELRSYREQIGTMEKLQLQIPLDDQEDYDIEKGSDLISIIEDSDIAKLNLQQLYILYRKAPDVFWDACNRKIIAENQRLYILKFDQLLSANSDQFVQALTHKDIVPIFAKNIFLLECLIQKVSDQLWDDAKVQDLFIHMLTRLMDLQEDSPEKKEEKAKKALALIREGNEVNSVVKILANENEININPNVTLFFPDSKVEVVTERELLMTSSSVFLAMLVGGFKENKKDKVELKDDDPEIFKILLNGIHDESSLKVSIENWPDLYLLANKWNFKSVVRNLQNWANIQIKNIAHSQFFSKHANFYKKMNLRILTTKLDQAYLSRLQLEASQQNAIECVLSNKYLVVFRNTKTLLLVDSCNWLSDNFKTNFTNWLKNEGKLPSNQLIDKLHEFLLFWEIINPLSRDEVETGVIKFIHECVVNENIRQEPKFLAKIWEMASENHNKIFRDIIVNFCRDPKNAYYIQIAWVSPPLEFQ